VIATLTIEDLEYDLSQDKIATHPASPRSSAKMLVVQQGANEHRNVSDLPELLPIGAMLIVNETSVLPARFVTRRVDSGGRVEGLFLEQHAEGTWLVMCKSNGKLRSGVVLELSTGVHLTLAGRDGANWICTCDDARPASEILISDGMTPLPPYILSARGGEKVADSKDKEWYQTVYADPAQNQSVAAPTAGLHFDELLLDRLDKAGIQRVPVTLHVGAGTFKAIETRRIEDHQMHAERWLVCQDSLDAIKKAKSEDRPIIAVGTTSVRTLESLPSMGDWPTSGGLCGSTKLMISPPHDFSLVDGLLTNFHLPKSTLLALVAAMIGIDKLRDSYDEAMEGGYRFYSYGDAMFVPPK
jgi:S-adenosylmethionine:tRNA ribosyltransferase-isomerase